MNALADRLDQRLVPASSAAELRDLRSAMLAAGLAAFSLLYCTQALLPAIGTTFGVGAALSSLTVSCATGALALAIVPLSSIAESAGRPMVMRLGLGFACLLGLMAAAMPQLWLLLVVRGLMGVALAAVVAVAMGHLGDEIPPSATGAAIGIYVSGTSLGGILGRLIPGISQDVVSWRAAMAILVGFSSLAVAAFIRLLPPARQFQPMPLRLHAHATALRELWADPGVRRLCAVGFLLMGGFVACYNFRPTA